MTTRNHGTAGVHHQSSSSSSSQWLATLVSLSVAAFAVIRLSDWRTQARSAPAGGTLPVILYESGYDSNLVPLKDRSFAEAASSGVGLSSPPPPRWLVVEKESGGGSSGTIDDDITRDDVCSDYLTNFLNGTTDSKDICQAMYKAWQGADCKDHVGNIILAGTAPVDSSSASTSFFSTVTTASPVVLQKNHSGGGANHSATDDALIDDAFEKWQCCSFIGEYYGKHCQQQSPLDAHKLLGIVVVLIICGGVKSLLRIANVQWIPDAGACIVVGALVGGVLRLAQTNLGDKILAFNNDLFLQIMLPPIVFEAALSIEKRAFRRDLFPILTFAVVGT
jgi:Sodium/hydrogen exchanger family